jgi:DNA-binding response OmpR family regulator
MSLTQNFTLSQNQMTLCKTGHAPVTLTSSETSILVTLARAPGQRVAYWQIAETLGVDLESYAKASLEVRMVRLRKKIVEAGADSSCIESVRNHGYQLCIPLKVV